VQANGPRELRDASRIVLEADEFVALQPVAALVGPRLAFLSVMAHAQAFFAFDPLIEQSIQAAIPVPPGRVLDAVSWVGFPPQVNVVIGVGIVIVLTLGYRWEATCLAFAWDHGRGLLVRDAPAGGSSATLARPCARRARAGTRLLSEWPRPQPLGVCLPRCSS
jgi:hypothetical protein